MALLEIRDLSLTVRGRQGETQILDRVSFEVSAGECVALVGESGSGKSMTTKAIVGAQPRGARLSGEIRFDGADTIRANRGRILQIRREDIAMIYQDPRAGVNPIQRIGDFIIEGVTTAGRMRKDAARTLALDLMKAVRLRDPEQLMSRYPFELSGGMLQRVMIVSALMSSPRLLLCDEPTTALDVTNQAEVVSILGRLQKERNLAMVFITHDLDLAGAISDRVCVMKSGAIVETGTTTELLHEPKHPYTRALLAARPVLGGDRSMRLPTITETLTLKEAEA